MVATGARERTRRASARSATKNVLFRSLASVAVTCSRPKPYALALTTAAHSTVRAWRASARQFAAMAARSMLSVPPVSGSVGVSAGSGSGSASAMCGVMTAVAAAVKCKAERRSKVAADLITGLVRGIEIGEARDRGLELQFHCAGWAVALFADDQFRLARHAFAFGEPLSELFAVRFHRLAHLVIIFFAEHEQHHVGVLLDRARLAQIGELRPFVITAFDLPRQLR